MRTNTDFFRAVMKMANLKSLKQAEEAANAVVLLTRANFGAGIMRKASEVSSQEALKDREATGAAQLDDYERDERLFEIGEVEE